MGGGREDAMLPGWIIQETERKRREREERKGGCPGLQVDFPEDPVPTRRQPEPEQRPSVIVIDLT